MAPFRDPSTIPYGVSSPSRFRKGALLMVSSCLFPMHGLGNKHVYDISGGITAWAGAGLPTT